MSPGHNPTSRATQSAGEIFSTPEYLQLDHMLRTTSINFVEIYRIIHVQKNKTAKYCFVYFVFCVLVRRIFYKIVWFFILQKQTKEAILLCNELTYNGDRGPNPHA